ncbi:uncharacterized protein LOC133302941 [Gastrolobium bilobum]|uniref:uncharacterized protein LOC133302941 n=1 Tax=Gastrolobium bilobum TaxID=150636 RepID=UPI002AB3118F|nr:uncharacterized protein LOC133302941 [Gastrolobium bilobum]
MSLLIPGPRAPGNDIDVYLQPLIDELKELWEKGVETYDASVKETFQLHASILWTINDFPAYANLSGWSTKGKLACPCCNMDTWSLRLPNGRKHAYMGSRRFLPLDHYWRNNAKAFDGNKEKRPAPKQLSGDDIVEQLQNFNQVQFGKFTRKRKRGEIQLPGNWRKKSIFFELPYWRYLKLRHNLDVMHIEKNVCDNIIGTLMNLEGKTKDNINSRFDLAYMGIRPELHATTIDEDEAKIAGPVQYRWMYPIERYLRRLKSYVGNKAHPEGSIAEAYIAQECLHFCSRLHKEKLKNENSQHVEQRHAKEFYQWFKKHITFLKNVADESINESLFDLACGPDTRVFRYTSYLINGWRFNIKDRDMHLKSQNSGILVKGDNNTGNLDYFGVLTDIVELMYSSGNNVILFKCDWWDVSSRGRGYKEDRYDFFLININRRLNTDEPYVLATQAQQVYYVKDTKDLNWLVVVNTKPRDFYDMPWEVNNEPCQENDEIGLVHELCNEPDDEQAISLDRNDLEQPTVDGSPMVHVENVDNEEESDYETLNLIEDEESDGIHDEYDSDDD